MFPKLVTPPARPIDLDDIDVTVLPRRVGEMVGAGRAREDVFDPPTRPADIRSAEVSEVEAIWLPLWRIEGSVDGFHVGLVETIERTGPDVIVQGGPDMTPPSEPPRKTRRRTRPVGGFRHHDGTFAMLARRGFPIDPSEKVKLPLAELVPLADHALDPSKTVAPDLSRDDAEGEAKHRLTRKGQPAAALVAHVDARVKDLRLVFYPLYVLRYRYAGDAIAGDALFHSAVSGVSGKVVSHHHPPVLASLGGKLRKLFGV